MEIKKKYSSECFCCNIETTIIINTFLPSERLLMKSYLCNVYKLN